MLRLGSRSRLARFRPQVFDVVDRFVEHDRDVVVTERVHDRPAVAFGSNEIEMAQQTELVGDRRLLHPDLVGDDRHRPRCPPQPDEDSDAAGRGERLTKLRDRLGKFEIDQRRRRQRSFDAMAHGR